LNSVCTATKRDGTPCTLPSYGSNNLCWAHSPETAERRRRGQSRGGKSKPNREIADLKRKLENLAEDVLAERVDRSAAVVVNQIINTRARLIELERKIKEQDEVLERIEALEAQQAGARGGTRRWG
jgi:septal ring factor EnvC (AmiA/AmiB activator)